MSHLFYVTAMSVRLMSDLIYDKGAIKINGERKNVCLIKGVGVISWHLGKKEERTETRTLAHIHYKLNGTD